MSTQIGTAPRWAYRGEAWDLPARLAREAAELADSDLNALLDEVLPRWGRRVWRHEGGNLVTDVGARWLITQFIPSPPATSWFILFKGTGTIANADTAASHAGWSELHTYYSQTTRPALTLTAPVSGRSASNAASPASVSVTSAVTVYGAGLVSSNVKNGPAGVLYGAADYGSPRALTVGQIYRLQATVSF